MSPVNVIVESLTALNRGMFERVNPASNGLVSVAPKNNTPTIVVNQSRVPMRMIDVQNKTVFLTMLVHCPCRFFPKKKW